MMAGLPRAEGDGMDSERLRQQDLIIASQQQHPVMSPPVSGRHRNLNMSPSSATFTRSPAARYEFYVAVHEILYD